METTLNLNETDVEILRKKKNIMTAILSGVFCFFAIIVYIILGLDSNKIYYVFGIIFCLFPLAMIVFLIYSFHRDLRVGKKKVITGIVSDKTQEIITTGTSKNKSSSTYYYLTIDDRKIKTEGRFYNLAAIGDKVELQMTTVSQIDLDFKIIEHADFASDKFSKNNNFDEIGELYSTEIDMNEQDIEKIKKIRNKRLVFSIIWSAIISYSGYWILMFVYAVFIISALQIKDPQIIRLGTFIIFISIISLAIYLIYKRLYIVQKDINDKIKIIKSAIISNKTVSDVKVLRNNVRITSSRGKFYYFDVNNKYYEVSPEVYGSKSVGDKIKVCFAKNSGIFISLEIS